MINRFLLSSFLLASFVFAGCATRRPAAPPAPTVTAKAWAIADGRTGKLLWSFNADEPRNAASTAKIMCAYVVLQLAERQPAVLDEVMTLSLLAKNIPGSSAGIQLGERLSVRDCLYGLLLPSGNDAGYALAEHFNDRFDPPDDGLKARGLDRPKLATRNHFIAEMNRTAQRLGMTNTIYLSPLGDGGMENDRTTTVRDLTHLAWHAMQNSRFREYVATRQHTAQVQTPGGGVRTITWNNANRLLALEEGYDGIKTGINQESGACLVSSVRHGKDHLLATVLGSEASEDSYIDTRKLYDWAWQQRGHR
jgi:D-alanyl-D-alanine carboxypeptidase (penicillin-binding protein 5/6)